MSIPSTVIHQAAHALKQSAHPALRRLAVEESEESLVIVGRVPSFYLKQLAQETLMPIKGQRHLVNLVDVVPE